MQKNPYIVLGVSENSTQEEITIAYEQLKDSYQNDLFREGEIGNNATKKLSEIENAYNQCIENINQNIIYENTGSTYGDIESLIREGKLEQAQNQLDRISTRQAEWHYLQSVLFYKRNWHLESKKQLEIALALDEGNEKYQGALDRLNKMIDDIGISGSNNDKGNNQNKTQQEQKNQSRAGYTRPNNTGGASNADACCNTCNCLICTDCCCECMGGDCIPCC